MSKGYRNFKVTDDDAPLIDKLSDEHRAVLTAQGKTADVAASLGINVGTVKSRLHRARAALVALRPQPQVMEAQ